MPVFHRHFSSDPFSVAAIIEDLINQFDDHNLRCDCVSTIEIVLSEVINNINEHAYCGAPDRPIEIRAELGRWKIYFELVDCGIRMPNNEIPAGNIPDLSGQAKNLPEGGFGWPLIRQLTDDLKYARQDDQNHLSFNVTIDQLGAEV